MISKIFVARDFEFLILPNTRGAKFPDFVQPLLAHGIRRFSIQNKNRAENSQYSIFCRYGAPVLISDPLSLFERSATAFRIHNEGTMKTQEKLVDERTKLMNQVAKIRKRIADCDAKRGTLKQREAKVSRRIDQLDDRIDIVPLRNRMGSLPQDLGWSGSNMLEIVNQAVAQGLTATQVRGLLTNTESEGKGPNASTATASKSSKKGGRKASGEVVSKPVQAALIGEPGKSDIQDGAGQTVAPVDGTGASLAGERGAS